MTFFLLRLTERLCKQFHSMLSDNAMEFLFCQCFSDVFVGRNRGQ
jgi:hypothetical protein